MSETFNDFAPYSPDMFSQNRSSADDLLTSVFQAPLVTASSSLVAYFLYTLNNHLSDYRGLIYGTINTRTRRAINDTQDVSHSSETCLTVRNFVGCGNDEDSSGLLYNFALRPNKELIRLHNEDRKVLNNGTEEGRASKLLGWFGFYRTIDESFLDSFAQVTSGIASMNHSNDFPTLFLLAYERETGSEFKPVGPEIRIRVFALDKNDQKLKPVNLKISNVGDTSHAEYTEILERRAASFDDQFLGGFLKSNDVGTTMDMTCQQANAMIQFADKCLDNTIHSISNSAARYTKSEAGPSETGHFPASPCVSQFLIAPMSKPPSTKLVNINMEETHELPKTRQNQNIYLMTPIAASNSVAEHDYADSNLNGVGRAQKRDNRLAECAPNNSIYSAAVDSSMSSRSTSGPHTNLRSRQTVNYAEPTVFDNFFASSSSNNESSKTTKAAGVKKSKNDCGKPFVSLTQTNGGSRGRGTSMRNS